MITVLRLGHRIGRDTRISTHVGLVARAFGADGIIYSGERDSSLLESIERICGKWGGGFGFSYRKDWRNVVSGFRGTKVHLTMYGVGISSVEQELRQSKGDVLVVIGAEKVPAEIYGLVDYNVAVGHQPHSEVAALAVFLDRLLCGKGIEKDFSGSIKVLPCERGKRVVMEKDEGKLSD